MDLAKRMLVQNIAWADEAANTDPALFDRIRKAQSPKVLWFGCSDSRVPAETVTNMRPGDLFVHRNIANLFSIHDDSAMSVLEYAVHVLAVREIVVCGHYGCGGVRAALLPETGDLLHVQRRIRPLRELAGRHGPALARLGDIEDRVERLAELSVLEQVHALRRSHPVRTASHPIRVHGWIFSVRDGRIKALACESDDAENYSALQPA